MTETDHPLDRLDAPNRIIKRAQYEALAFELLETNVLVRNESHADPEDHEYLVVIDDGLPVSCTCPADEHYDNACKHRVAVAMRRPIIEFAKQTKLVADGGSIRETKHRDASPSDHTVGEREETADGSDCDCETLPDEFPCWECYRTGQQSFE
ncbi:SWIM zinc finger family protein [Haloarcula marina]|uniref:SWIM zinc finger family protein n=1 Tax=Haloarcula marina TaxID=2961574 RepID=UPI0020B8D805|nr:SWIM zinc finger family protein [Halomicroarcula marina]